MERKYFKNFYSYLYFIVGLVAIGCYVFCFAVNREFWLDEAFLGLNILKRSYFELWLPLDLYQVAPPIFLMISKFFYSIHPFLFLSPEQSLRLYPFICGLLSVPLFFVIAQKFIKNNLLLLIVFLLFCFNSRVVYYTQEFKQYMSDTFWGLFILWIFIQKDILKANFKRLFFYGLLIGCLLFLSYTTIFSVTAGLGMLFFRKEALIVSPFKINRKIFNKFILFGLGYLIPFSLLLLLNICNPHHEYMGLWWGWYGAFLKYDLSNLFVIFYAFLDFFFYGGKGTWVSYSIVPKIIFYDIPFILWLLVLFTPFLFFKQVGKKILYFSFFIFIISMSSYLKFYPVAERTLLYSYPLFLLIFGIYADSPRKFISYFSRFFLVWMLFAVGVNSFYKISRYSVDNLSIIPNSIKKLKTVDITPVYINETVNFPIFPLPQQEHDAVFVFYRTLFNYYPEQVVRYYQPRNRGWLSENCFEYLSQNLRKGQKYALIWEDSGVATFEEEGGKLPLDCFVRFGRAQSLKKVENNLYIWTQK